MGLDLVKAPAKPVLPALLAFIDKVVTTWTRPMYMDGSFAIYAPQLTSVTQPPAMLTRGYSSAATGVYLLQSNGSTPLALLIRTPKA